jgi:hypothetical protein
MKKRNKSRLVAGTFVLTLLSQVVYAEIDPNVLSNTVDVLTAIRAIANEVSSSSKPISSDLLSPTAEQRAIIINEIAKGAGGDSDVIQQMIVNAQAPIQSILESTSCAVDNRVVYAAALPFPTKPSFISPNQTVQTTIVNSCADAVHVDQWKMHKPETLEFTAMFRPAQSEQINIWRFKMKRQSSGIWELESRKNVTAVN